MSRITWAYLAGFLDGDGWITHSKNSNCATERWVIGLTQKATRRGFMEQIHAFLEEHGVRAQIFDRWVRPPYMKERTLMTNVAVKAQESLVIMITEMIPHILMKEELAARCLTFASGRIDQRGVGVSAPAKQETNTYWKQGEVTELLRLQGSGHSNLSIASKLGRSCESVAHKLTRLGVRRPKSCHGDVLAAVANDE